MLLPIGLVAAQADPAPFAVHSIELPFPIRQAPVLARVSASDRKGILVFAEDDRGQAWALVYTVPSGEELPREPRWRVALPPEVVAYDVGTARSAEAESVHFLTATGVSRWRPGGDVEAVIETPSIYRRRPPETLPRVEFLRDVDGDGDFDLVVPDFAVYRIARAEAEGFAAPQALDIPAVVRTAPSGMTYDPIPLDFQDVTLDGESDLVFVRSGELRVHPGAAGRFALEPVAIPIPMALADRPQRGELAEVDQRGQVWRHLVSLDDFNGDRLPDLFVQTVQSSGVFDKQHTLALHLGERRADALGFSAEPRSRIESTVVVDEPVLDDIDGDGKLDVALGAVDFGLTTVVSALLTGSIDVEIAVHRLREDDRFEDGPSAREEVSIDVDLGSGKTTIPLAKLADVDGDGRKDLLIGEGTKAIRIHRGIAGARSFASEFVTFETELPANGSFVETGDVDGDGREDLVLRYGKLDGPGRDRTLRVLLARCDGKPK